MNAPEFIERASQGALKTRIGFERQSSPRRWKPIRVFKANAAPMNWGAFIMSRAPLYRLISWRWAVDHVSGFGVLDAPKFDIVVLNPPLSEDPHNVERRRMSAAGSRVPNLYAGFVTLPPGSSTRAASWWRSPLAASANGPGWAFRKLLLEAVGLRRIHVFNTHNIAFARDSEVLQENVIFAGTRGHRPATLVVSSSRSVSHAIRAADSPYAEVVRPNKRTPSLTSRLMTGKQYATNGRLAVPVAGSGMKVSTGHSCRLPLEGHLRALVEPGANRWCTQPHAKGRVLWPRLEGRKPNGLVP